MKLLKSISLLALAGLTLSGCATMNAVQALMVSSKLVTGHDEKNNVDLVDGIVKVGGLLSSWEALHFTQARNLTTGKISYSLRLEANETMPKLYDKAIFYVDSLRTDWVPPSVLSSNPQSYFDGVNIYYKSNVGLIQGESTLKLAADKDHVIALAEALIAASDVSIKIFQAGSDLTSDYKFAPADVVVLKSWLDAIHKTADLPVTPAAPVAPKVYASVPWAKLWAPSFASDYDKKDVKVEALWLGTAKQLMHVSGTTAPYNSGDWVEVGATTKDDVKDGKSGQYPNQYWGIYVAKDNSDAAFALAEGKLVVLYGTAHKVVLGGIASTVLEVDRMETP
jgi:hypothetical protein